MTKKTLIICLVALLALAGIAAFGIAKLYKGDSGDDSAVAGTAISEYSLLPAVPSDAVMLLCTSSFGETLSLLNDSTKVFGAVLTDSGKRGFSDFISALSKDTPSSVKGYESVLSMHYSGELTPLLLLKAPVDTTDEVVNLLALADSSSLAATYLNSTHLVPYPGVKDKLMKGGLILVSSSQTLITASLRHLEGDMSVLDKTGFPQIAAKMGGRSAVMISNDYAGKLFTSHISRAYAQYSTFFKDLADWTGFTVGSVSPESISLKGAFSSSSDPTYFANVFSSIPGGESRFADVFPSSTIFAVSVPTPSITDYLDAYKNFLDAHAKLDKYRRDNAALRDTLSVTPEQFVIRLDAKEVVKATVRLENSTEGVVALRMGKPDPAILLKGTGLKSMKEYKGEVLPFLYDGFLSTEFGGLFTPSGKGYFAVVGQWLITGSQRAVSYVADPDRTLSTELSDASLSSKLPSKNTGPVCFFSLSEYPPLLDEVFRPTLSVPMRQTLTGVTHEIFTLALSGGEASVSVDRATVVKNTAPVVERDTVVVVPTGPFKVHNSGTGRTNLFSQSANNTLTLKEEDGKGIWGIPFTAPICGYVETIDYYGNDRNQFLFAAGSKLYLIDRLGRFVNGFPAELGKDVLLGPAVYDFTGAHGYTAMVLHKDNTIGMYNLHGQTKEGWLGITAPETIKTLPELLEVKGTKYWVVRTSIRALVFPFDGGEPLTKGEGAKMIRNDSVITPKDNGSISATCRDGKERNFKLQ